MAQKLVSLLVNGLVLGSFLVDANAFVTTSATPVGLTAKEEKKHILFALPKGNIAIAVALRDLWLKVVNSHPKEIKFDNGTHIIYTYCYPFEPAPGWGECDWCTPYTVPELVAKGSQYRQYRLKSGEWVFEQRECKDK